MFISNSIVSASKAILILISFTLLISCAFVPHSKVVYFIPNPPEKSYSLVVLYNADRLGQKEKFWIDEKIAARLTAQEYSYFYVKEGLHKLIIGENTEDLQLLQEFVGGETYYYRWESGFTFRGVIATKETFKILRVPNKFASNEIKSYYYGIQENKVFE